MANARPSNSGRHSRSLSELEDVIKRAVGFPQQCVGEISEDDIREFVYDSLSIVTAYKPLILEKTIDVSSSTGTIVATGIFYDSTWKAGDAVPAAVARLDVQCYLSVNPAQTVHGRTQTGADSTDPFDNGFGFPGVNGGVALSGSTSLSSNMTLHGMFDDFIDFQIVQQNLQAGMSMATKEFYWEQDYNTPGIVYFANLPPRARRLTIRVALEHKIGSQYYLPSSDTTVGTAVVAYDERISGSILRYTHDLALGKVMKKIGMIRSKIQGGMNQFQLNGDTMISEGNTLEERTLEILGSGGDLWGSFNDGY